MPSEGFTAAAAVLQDKPKFLFRHHLPGFFCPVWGRLTHLISEKSKINPPNGPLFTLRWWIAIAKKSPPPQRF
jgi:hypothetical protein